MENAHVELKNTKTINLSFNTFEYLPFLATNSFLGRYLPPFTVE